MLEFLQKLSDAPLAVPGSGTILVADRLAARDIRPHDISDGQLVFQCIDEITYRHRAVDPRAPMPGCALREQVLEVKPNSLQDCARVAASETVQKNTLVVSLANRQRCAAIFMPWAFGDPTVWSGTPDAV
jgi:hypothetical protein